MIKIWLHNFVDEAKSVRKPMKFISRVLKMQHKENFKNFYVVINIPFFSIETDMWKSQDLLYLWVTRKSVRFGSEDYITHI